MAEISALRRIRALLWIAVVLVAAGATALFVLRPPSGTVGASYADKPFTLQNAAGGTFTNADLTGKPTLLFFGYTFCPDVCPTTLSDTIKWRQDLGIGYDKLRTVFVSIDPDRDTPAILKSYLAAFDSSIIGAAGDAANTEAVKTIFGVVAEKGKDDGTGFYLVNHTASLFLIGINGEYEGTVAYGEDRASAEAKIKRLVNG